jgi:hypothetical protein
MPFSSIRKEGYNTTQGTGANLLQHSLAADASVTWLQNRLSPCYLSFDLFCTDWSLTKSKLDSAVNSTEKHYSKQNVEEVKVCDGKSLFLCISERYKLPPSHVISQWCHKIFFVFLFQNIPFDISNRYKLTALFIVFFGSGLALPFFVLRHQLLKKWSVVLMLVKL